MPPKKKKGSGKGKGGSGPSSAKGGGGGGGGGAGENLSALSKEFFLIQISDLEERLARYQRKCDEIELANEEFHKQYDQLQVDKRDIVQYLKKQLDMKNDEVADLTDRLRGLQQAKEAEKESAESQLTSVRAEFQEKKEHLTSENILLGGKLAGLEEFKVQKDSLMNKFADMEDEVAKKETQFKETVYSLERKNVIDKDRLKKEMVQRVNQVAAEFRKVSNKQMADTTKRTIRENVAINVQLAKMSDKTTQLIKENDDLAKKLKDARRKIQLQEDVEKDLAKKNHSNQKVIELLSTRCQLMESHLAELEAHEADFQDMQSELQQLQRDFESGKDDVEEVTLQRNSLEKKLEETKKKLEEEKETRRALEKVVNGAAAALTRVLAGEDITPPVEKPDPPQRSAPDGSIESDAAASIDPPRDSAGRRPPPSASTADDESASEATSGSKRQVFLGKEKAGMWTEEEKRTMMLTHLLAILNAAAELEEGEERKKKPRRRSADLHYRPGDAGLLTRTSTLRSDAPTDRAPDRPPDRPPSRPHLTHAQRLERLRLLSPTTRLGKLEMSKPSIRSVGTQTASAPRAVFYAEQLLEHGGPVALTRDGPVKLPPPGHPPHPLARRGPPPRQHLAPLGSIAGTRRTTTLI